MDADAISLVVRARDDASAEFAKIHQSLDTLTNKSSTAGKAMSSLQSILQGIGMGVGMAIFNDLQNALSKLTTEIPQLITQGLTFAATVNQLSLDTGGTAEQASHLLSTFQFLGISTDSLSTKIGTFSTYVVAHAAAMHALGIAATDANGAELNGLTILDNARQALAGYTDGVAKAAEVKKLFGRAGLDLLPYLSLENSQIAALNKEWDTLGLTMNASGVLQAKAVSQEMNLVGLSVQGVANKLLNDVGPALMSGMQMIADWVTKNGTAIATFASDVVNFTMGMVSALTGASFSTVNFATSLNALGGAASTAAMGTDAATGAAKANTKAIDDEITKNDALITKLKALGATQDAQFTKDMAQISAKLGLELSALDTTEKRHAIDEQRASLASQLADAQQNLSDAMKGTTSATGVVTVDPKSVEAAQDQIASIMQSSADFEQNIADDSRKEQIASVQAYIDAVGKAETDAVDKKKWAENEKQEATSLQSQIAAATASGAIQEVSDLTLQLDAVNTAITKAGLDTRNAVRETDLEKQKAQLADLKAAATATATGAGGIGPVFTEGSKTATTAIANLAVDGRKNFQNMSMAISSPTATGSGGSIAGAFLGAQLAGEAFGKSVKGWLSDISTLMGAFVGPSGPLGMLRSTMVELDWLAHPNITGEGVFGKDLWAAMTSGGLPDFTKLFPTGGSIQPVAGKAAGGPVVAGASYLVGEQGPERLTMGGQGGFITPNGAPGGTVTFGDIIINGIQDPAALADVLALHIKRSLTRQGMTFATGF